MNLRPPSPLYNPGGASDEDFLSGFVARKELLELLLNGVRHVARGGASEHQLIVGQRGMGKSSLLRAVAVHVKSDDELRGAFAPLQFREEQYNVNALDVFWRNCGEALAQWCEDNALDALAGRLDRAIESEAWRDTETAANGFLEACAETGKRAILLLDNLDLIVDALKPGEPWALRRVLQMAGGPLVVGASTRFLRESGDREAAFYEFFHPHVLEPLSESELTRCLRALADRAGQTGDAVKTILEQEPGRVRALYALTGGNPRVLAMTYQLLERRETSDVFADLEALLDKVSPYYKARVEEYATPQQRSVIDAIALNWDPILSHDLSAKAGVEVTTVSTHLHRLKRDGFIEEVATSGARAGYQIAERFLNIWYLMRHGTRRTRQRLAGLAAFFARLYSAPELERMARMARDGEASRHWPSHYRDALIEAERQSFEFSLYQSVLKESEQIEVNSLSNEARVLSPGISKQSFDITLYREGLAQVSEAVDLLSEALQSYSKEKFDLALELFDRAVPRFSGAGNSFLKKTFVLAMMGRGVALRALGRSEEAVAAYETIDARFGGETELDIREQVARGLVTKGSALGALGRGEEEIAAYDAVDVRFGAEGEPAIRQQVAWALVNKGIALGALGRREEEIAVYDAIDARFGGEGEPAIRAQVATALILKGWALDQLGRGEEEIAVYDAVEARFGADSDPAIREKVAEALVDKAYKLFYRFGDLDAAESLYIRALRLDSTSMLAKGNLALLLATTMRPNEVPPLRAEMSQMPLAGRALVDAAVGLANDNFGLAIDHFAQTLSAGLEPGAWNLIDGILSVLRLAEARGFGERLIGWFETSGFDIKYAPVHAAFVAYVRGERFLRDVNPEVRRPAQDFYDKLSAPRRHAGGGEPAGKPNRGRKRKA